jgi:hypothetical protein
MLDNVVAENVVHEFPKARAKGRSKARPAKSVTAGFRRRLRRQGWAAVFTASLVVVLTALSLEHLANGIVLITRAPLWEAWAMAIGIDLGFLAFECGTLCAATPKVREEVERFARPAIAGTLIVSALLNAAAFGAQAEGLLVYLALPFGLVIPAMIYAASRVAFTLAVRR